MQESGWTRKNVGCFWYAFILVRGHGFSYILDHVRNPIFRSNNSLSRYRMMQHVLTQIARVGADSSCLPRCAGSKLLGRFFAHSACSPLLHGLEVLLPAPSIPIVLLNLLVVFTRKAASYYDLNERCLTDIVAVAIEDGGA